MLFIILHYSIEFEALICFLIIIPDCSVVLIHHDAWTAPMQMNVNYCYENKMLKRLTDDLFVALGNQLQELFSGGDDLHDFLLLFRRHVDLIF